MGPSLTPPMVEVVLESCAYRRLQPTRKQIALALLNLATCTKYSVVRETFEVSKTTVHRCVYAVCTRKNECYINGVKLHTAIPRMPFFSFSKVKRKKIMLTVVKFYRQFAFPSAISVNISMC